MGDKHKCQWCRTVLDIPESLPTTGWQCLSQRDCRENAAQRIAALEKKLAEMIRRKDSLVEGAQIEAREIARCARLETLREAARVQCPWCAIAETVGGAAKTDGSGYWFHGSLDGTSRLDNDCKAGPTHRLIAQSIERSVDQREIPSVDGTEQSEAQEEGGGCPQKPN